MSSTMKKSSIILSSIGCLAIFASCSNEIVDEKEQEFPSAKGPLVINVVADSVDVQESMTRAYGEFRYAIKWNANDEISITDAAKSQRSTLTMTGGEGSDQAIFSQSADDPYIWSGNIYGYYPKTLLSEEVGYPLIWPEKQAYINKLAGMPMILSANVSSESSTTTFQFNTIGGAIQTILTSTKSNIVLDHITLEAENIGLSGTFDIENGTAKNFEPGTTITVDFGADGLNISSGFKNVFFNVPPTSTTTFTFTAYTKEGAVATFKKSNVSVKHKILSRLNQIVDDFKFYLKYKIQDNIDVTKEFDAPITSITSEVLGKDPDAEYPTPLNIISIEFPSSVQTIGNNAFLNEAHLVDVSLNEGLVTIGDNAFDTAETLATLTIPSSVTTIGGFAFAGCGNLESIVFTGPAPTTIGENAFSFSGTNDVIDVYVPAAYLEDYKTLFALVQQTTWMTTINLYVSDDIDSGVTQSQPPVVFNPEGTNPRAENDTENP